MQRLILGILLALGVAVNAYAQNPVVTQPSKRTATVTANTITTTNTFQSIYAANLNRLGCIVQNNGTNNMRLNIVSRATAAISASAVIAPGGSASCTLYGTVITGEISITGTAGDWFYGSQY